MLLVDRDREFNLTKDVIANSLETMLVEVPVPPLLIQHSLDKIRDHHPALNSFLSNITAKVSLSQKSEARDVTPLYAYFGVEGEPKAVLEIVPKELSGRTSLLLIGTSRGTCSLFSMDALKWLTNLYG